MHEAKINERADASYDLMSFWYYISGMSETAMAIKEFIEFAPITDHTEFFKTGNIYSEINIIMMNNRCYGGSYTAKCHKEKQMI